MAQIKRTSERVMMAFALALAIALIPAIEGASLISAVQFLSSDKNAMLKIEGFETNPLEKVYGVYDLWQYDYSLTVNEGAFDKASIGFGSAVAGADLKYIYPYRFEGNGTIVALGDSDPCVT